jgi:hypothetical protein
MNYILIIPIIFSTAFLVLFIIKARLKAKICRKVECYIILGSLDKLNFVVTKNLNFRLYYKDVIIGDEMILFDYNRAVSVCYELNSIINMDGVKNFKVIKIEI